MSSRFALVLIGALGCTDDAASLVEIEGRALVDVELVPPADTTKQLRDTGSYRWFVVDAPAGSVVQDPPGDATARFVPDLRGSYLFERWFVTGVAQDLTHRFVVQIQGVPPTASPLPDPGPYAVGSGVRIDGAPSSSLEGRPLTYHWRLASRPLQSVATIEQEAVQIQLVPDVAGDYLVELSVFDGELWNDTPASVIIIVP